MQAYLAKTTPGTIYEPGPLGAIEDPVSGNIIFAMGLEGVLIRSPANTWRAVAVNKYHPSPAEPNLAVLAVLLGDQFLLAWLTAGWIYVILAVPRLALSKKWMRVVLWFLVGMVALVWLALVLIFPPVLTGYLGSFFVSSGLLLMGLLLVVIALALTVDLLRSPSQHSQLPNLFLTALGGGALFFLPSLLWAYNILTTAAWAIGLSLLCVTAVILTSFWKLPRLYLSRLLQSLYHKEAFHPMRKHLTSLQKGFDILAYRIRTQGLYTTLLWVYGRGLPALTGVPLLQFSRVTEQLYVGPQFKDAGKRMLEAQGITACVNMRIEKDDAQFGLALERYLYLPTIDDSAPSIEHLDQGVAFIREVIRSGGKVYIHCGAGVGRAPSMAAAYLMAEGRSLAESLALIRTVRPFIKITPPQMAQLQVYEQRCQGKT